MKNARVLTLTTLAWLVVISAGKAEFESERLQNWHQWRGPNATGVAPQADPPIEWGEDKNVKWKVPVPGEGSASPVVWGERIFLLSAIETDRQADREEESTQAADQAEGQGGGGEPGRRGGGRRGGSPPANYYQFVVLCYDRNTGEKLWQQVATEQVPHEGHHPTNTYASGSPVTNGERVYANFGSRGIYCYDMDGNLQWERDLGDMQTRLGFGEGSTPALHGDTLVVPWDHEGQSLVYALDANTGETKWQVERDEVTTWATPLVVEAEGRTQVVVHGTNRVKGYDLATGEELWECGGQASNPIASPVRQDDLVYCMTGHRGYAVHAIPLASQGDITGTDQVAWNKSDTGPYIASPVLYKGHLYFTKGRDAILSCVDAKTGEPVYDQKRLSRLGTLYASPVAAADRIYITDRDGVTMVIKHGPEMEELAVNQLDEGIDASPAIVGEQMFIRGAEHLYCIERE